MAAHLYWRVRSITQQDQSGRYCTIADIVFAGVPGGPQLAVGGTPTSGSQYGGQAAALAFDGDPNTEWESGGGGPFWVCYQFPQAVEIVETRITVNDYYPNERILTGVVEWSDDGNNWSESAPINPTWGQTAGVQTQSFAPVNTPADARAALFTVVVPQSNPLVPAKSSQIAYVVPVADVALPSLGAQSNQLAFVVPGYYYEDKGANHGYTLRQLWGFPLLIQTGV